MFGRIWIENVLQLHTFCYLEIMELQWSAPDVSVFFATWASRPVGFLHRSCLSAPRMGRHRQNLSAGAFAGLRGIGV